MAATDDITADYEDRVRASFERQAAMATIGAELTLVTPGIVEIEMPFSAALTQQHGFLHAGVISAALDSACGYAAFSLMPADAAVLTIEFKVNLLAPGKGERFLFRGSVTKPARPPSPRVREPPATPACCPLPSPPASRRGGRSRSPPAVAG